MTMLMNNQSSSIKHPVVAFLLVSARILAYSIIYCKPMIVNYSTGEVRLYSKNKGSEIMPVSKLTARRRIETEVLIVETTGMNLKRIFEYEDDDIDYRGARKLLTKLSKVVDILKEDIDDHEKATS